MSASSLSLPIFLRINFLISYLIVTDSQNTFDWHTQRALLNDKKAGAGCTSRAFKHPGRDVTAPDVWPSILTDYTYDSELDNADGVPLASRRSSMFPEGNFVSFASVNENSPSLILILHFPEACVRDTYVLHHPPGLLLLMAVRCSEREVWNIDIYPSKTHGFATGGLYSPPGAV